MPLPLLQSPLPPSLFLLLPRCPAAVPPRTPTCCPLRLRHRRFRTSALPITDDELLRAITAPAGVDAPGARLPAIRSYDGDLASLTLIGAVGYDQAVTAAAADGGAAAEEHLSSGASTMVVETVFPGGSDECSTVSTRLFLPAKRVEEKANKLRSSLTTDILGGNPTVSKNILAMTFRQVILLQVWSFKLTLFCPGTERNMEDLASPREAPVDFTVSSSNVRILSILAEAVCSFALEGVERGHFGKADSSHLSYMFSWFQKPQGNCSLDSSICVYKISEREVVMNAMSQLDKFNSSKRNSSYTDRKLDCRWWMAPIYSRLEKAGGPEFSIWANEFVPSYRLQINADKFKDAKLEGWHQIANNRWEVLLTHFQMVQLANVLDIYYEDRYTLPNKQLLCSLITGSSKISMNKSSSWKMLIVTLAGACIFIALSIVAQMRHPHLLKIKPFTEKNNLVSSREIDGSHDCHIQSNGTAEVGDLCILVVKSIKDALGWPGDVHFDVEIGAWTGVLPSYLRNNDPSLHALDGEEYVKNFSDSDMQLQTEQSNSTISSSGTNHAEHLHAQQYNNIEMNSMDSHTTVQDIASFQVALSRDGKIIGLQPTSRVAVNHWASNPLAKLLYKGRKLSPGLIEPSLNISLPQEVFLLELLMSVYQPKDNVVLED
ncbi:hypothetical protein Cni_G18093 [Canna indica]|uniref:Uncharacterized protein n=1 Tax=Canna indica TaxID=4628 RepID=A0AAQ3KIM3_9LILI|nr:hypothetical protein Cni_G18093 [Canna indica]